MTNFLNKYTSLPVLLDILSKKAIPLLSPTDWEDRNDSYYIDRYKSKSGFATVLATCFTSTHERFHHWKVFASRSSGVCIEFNRTLLLDGVKKGVGFRSKDVRYLTIDQLNESKPDLSDWPFIKRIAFKDEVEFRIIYESKRIKDTFRIIAFETQTINKITLSPWMPLSVVDSVSRVINSINEFGHLNIIPSTLVDNPDWKYGIEPHYPQGHECLIRSH